MSPRPSLVSLSVSLSVSVSLCPFLSLCLLSMTAEQFVFIVDKIIEKVRPADYRSTFVSLCLSLSLSPSLSLSLSVPLSHTYTHSASVCACLGVLSWVCTS
jgi:hypothetical protein